MAVGVAIDVKVSSSEVLVSSPAGSCIRPGGGSVQIDRSTPDGGELSEEQAEVVAEALSWLLSLQRLTADHTDRCRVLVGYAGTGKTWTLKELIRRAKNGGLEGSIIGLAPTRQAAKVMRGLSNGMFDEIRTVDSFLGLRPNLQKWDEQSDEPRLARLQEKVSAGNAGELDLIMLQALEQRKQAAFEERMEFVPATDKEGVPVLDKNVEGVRWIVVDECSMIGARKFGFLLELLNSEAARPDLQILFVGDAAQLPPVGESLSKTFEVPRFAELTQPRRYGGRILEYCTAVRQPEAADYFQFLHPGQSAAYSLQPDQTFATMPYVSHDPRVVGGIDAIAEVFKAGICTARILCATNKEVWQANTLVRERIYGTAHLDYRVGDTLLSMGPVTRDDYGNCNVKRGATQIIASRELVKLTSVIPCGVLWVRDGAGVDPSAICGVKKDFDFVGYSALPEGCTHSDVAPMDGFIYFKLWRADWTYEDEPPEDGNYAPLILMDPNQLEAYTELCDRIKYLCNLFKSRPQVKVKNEAKGPAEACQYLGILNRWELHDGTKIDGRHFQNLRSKLWRNYYRLDQSCDRISYHYAGTAHSAQGVSLDIAAVDTGFLMPKTGYRAKAKKSSDWDEQKIAYTMGSRAAKQLIFLQRTYA